MKRRVVIASVLKPVNDTRMVEKIARTMADSRQFDIHVIGFPADVRTTDTGYTVHTLPFFNRISLKRFFIAWHVFRITARAKPDLLIVTTHELLLMAVIQKIISGCKIVYDVQENYYANILFTPAFPLLLRPFIALYVRLQEAITAPFIDHFFLAEKAYADELWFISKKKYTVLENKLRRPDNTLLAAKRNKNLLLFTGTLAATTGVFKAIEIAVKLNRIDANIMLSIIGYCAQRSVLTKIKKAIQPYPFIRLTGGDKLVPHDEIIAQIQTAGAGIISYPPNKATGSSVPTKLFEYIGYKLPIILTNHLPWIALCQQYHAACVFNPDDIKAELLLNTIKNGHFYPIDPTDVYWESEQPKLLRQVVQLMNRHESLAP